MADVWVKYRNKKSGAEGICKYTDYKSAIKRTDKLTIVAKYEGRPIGDGAAQRIESGKVAAIKKPSQKKKAAPVKEPEAAKQAIINKEKADKDKSNSESK